MKAVEKALRKLEESGQTATICVQGSTLALEEILGLTSQTLQCRMKGRTWCIDLGFISAVSGIPRRDLPPGEPSPLPWKQEFLQSLTPLKDPLLLAELAEEIELPDFTQSEELWSFMKEQFHQNPACLSEVDHIFDLLDELEETPSQALKTKAFNLIENTKLAFPQSIPLFECLRAQALFLSQEPFEAANALFTIGRFPECLCALGSILTPATEDLFTQMLGYALIDYQKSESSSFFQKLLLCYGRRSKTPQEVGLLLSLARKSSDPAIPAVLLALCRRKNPDFAPASPLSLSQLMEEVKRGYDAQEIPLSGDYPTLEAISFKRFCDLELGDNKKAFEEVEGRTFFQADVDTRFGSYSGYYQYWLSFQNSPFGKNSMYLNPHQIIDPLLAKCLTQLPLPKVQQLSVQFVAGENTTRVAATCAFLAPDSRQRALDSLSGLVVHYQKNTLIYYMDFFNLPKSEDDEMLRVFDRECVEDHRILDAGRARSDAQIFLFLHSILDQKPTQRQIPPCWAKHEPLRDCARHLLKGSNIAIRHLWLSRLIWQLRKNHSLGQDLLVKGFCHGLPCDHPFHYPLGRGRSKEAIFNDCLTQMANLRFLEAYDGFSDWLPKMLQKQRVDSPDQLKNASHRAQFDLTLSLREYCAAVLDQQAEKIPSLEKKLLESSLSQSLKIKLTNIFGMLYTCDDYSGS